MSCGCGGLDACGCCGSAVTANPRYNAPGQPSLTYRMGTHPAFLDRLLDRLPRQQIPPDEGIRPLARLTTRDPADPSIALLDGCATLLDVLSFYQERIVNEGFLRTATERRSILELARLIGYELSPGVAASAELAFQLEATAMPTLPAPARNGAPRPPPPRPEKSTDRVVVPAGTRVKSVPGPSESSQTFETVEAIEGRPLWNALAPRLTRPQDLALREVPDPDDSESTIAQLYFVGLNTDLGAGPDIVSAAGSEFFPLGDVEISGSDTVRAARLDTIYAAGTDTRVEKGDVILFVGKRPAPGETPDFATLTLVQTVRRVTVEPALERTRIDFADRPVLPAFSPLVFALGQMQLMQIQMQGATLQQTVAQQTWSESDLSVLIGTQGWDAGAVTTHINATHLFGAFTAPTPPPEPPPEFRDVEPGVFVFREQLGFFGHNAPMLATLPVDARPTGANWDIAPPSIWQRSNASLHSDVDTYLERPVDRLVDGSWVVFQGGGAPVAFWVTAVAQRSLADFALSGRATALSLAASSGEVLDEDAKNAMSGLKFRTTTAYAASMKMELARLPIADVVAAGSESVQLDGLYLGLDVGRRITISGERADLAGVSGGEAVLLTGIEHTGGFTTLRFEPALAHPYVRDTVTINANVAAATHGETVVEVLGGGDGSAAHQGFTLKRARLTYVPAATADGSESTLEVRVDDVLWTEAPHLYGLDPDDERYSLAQDDDGATTVRFGDGRSGARLPTGIGNVRARYRVGIGREGMVGAGSLSLLHSRPLGVGGVTNPAPAHGTGDPETRDDARQNAPRTVATLDRVVSLRDYEDFARTFSGIGKARADLISAGGRRWVQLTLAAETAAAGPSAVLAPRTVSADLRERLSEAIRRHGDPAQRFRVASYRPLFFNVRAEVLIDPRYELGRVAEDVKALLRDRFDFDHRSFAQPVAAAEVISVIHRAAGVVAVDLDQLYAYTEGASRPDPSEEITPEVLASPGARWRAGGSAGEAAVLPGALLLINPAGIELLPAFAPSAVDRDSDGVPHA